MRVKESGHYRHYTRFFYRIGLVASLRQVTGYSSGVNGKNKTKLKEKFEAHHGKEAIRSDEDIHHGEVVARRGEEEAE